MSPITLQSSYEPPPMATAEPYYPPATAAVTHQQSTIPAGHTPHSHRSARPRPVYTRNTQRVRVAFLRDRRGPCDWLLNILWFLLAGWHFFLAWFLAGILLYCTIVMIPCGIQVLKISWFLLFPFGQRIEATSTAQGGHCGGCNCCMNCIWMFTAGWILALQAIVTGILLCLTIVGIPFGWQCFKLAALCFWPFGLEVSPMELVETTTSVSTYSPLPHH